MLCCRAEPPTGGQLGATASDLGIRDAAHRRVHDAFRLAAWTRRATFSRSRRVEASRVVLASWILRRSTTPPTLLQRSPAASKRATQSMVSPTVNDVSKTPTRVNDSLVTRMDPGRRAGVLLRTKPAIAVSENSSTTPKQPSAPSASKA